MATATAIVSVPGTDTLSHESASLIERAKSIRVSDAKTAKIASDARTAAKQLLRQIEDTFDPHIEAAHKQHKNLIATKKKFTAPIDEAMASLNGELRRYEVEKERQRREEEARLQAEAKRQQEAEALRQASLLESQGETEAAEAVIEEAIQAPAPTVVLQREKIEGVTFRSVWKWEIADITKLPLNLLVVEANSANGLKQNISTSGIGALVRTLKCKAEAQIPGIRVWEDKTVV